MLVVLPFVVLLVIAGVRSNAADDRAAVSLWRPGGLKPTTDTLAMVLAALRKNDSYAGIPHDERRLDFAINASGIVSGATALVRKNDYLMTIGGPGVVFKSGRLAGRRWFDNTTGSLLRGGGPLAIDRFPHTELGFDAADCTLIGIADAPAPAWVLALRRQDFDSTWLFVDKKTGEIPREIYRSNVAVEVFTFGDFRGGSGNQRPYSYNVQGEGGPETVTVTGAREQPVSEADVAIPSPPRAIMAPPFAKQDLDARFGLF